MGKTGSGADVSAASGQEFESPRSYARRLGRPLNPARRDALENRLPQLELSLEELTAGPIYSLFGAPVKQVAMEIGFGDGARLLADLGKDHDTGWIACEPFLNGVSAFLKNLPEAYADRVRIWPGDARTVLDSLPDSALDLIYLLYPDPWPKTKHHKRRFVRPDNLDRVARVLKPGGHFLAATDVPELAEWMLWQIQPDGRFEWLAERAEDWQSAPSGWISTKYEQKAIAAGRTCSYLRFRRLSG